ncbi:MAG: recombinase family protein [Clostridia bacterium]|nr:recombinase family protein [Clostridia bacterium]
MKPVDQKGGNHREKNDPYEIDTVRQPTERSVRREEARRSLREALEQNHGGSGVIVIPPQPRQEKITSFPKLRVAAYCRVSTQEEQQIGSFEMQVHHFRQKIESNPTWELVEIYQDEGISGTSVAKRLGFQKMMTDAVNGKIDLILTKGISRFGRNIVDILNNLRILSTLNPPVTVSFEMEGITSTGGGSSNLLIAILSALAELESQQKSEAIKAGIRWRMAEGIYKFSVHNTLGYYRDHFGRLVIEPTEAKIVAYIYQSCLEGATPGEIAASLTKQHIKSPMGRSCWQDGTVRSILRNEKYCGDALMQKTYTKDFRTHQSVKNTDLNMYFKENHHRAIISHEDWNRVQALLNLRPHERPSSPLRQLSDHFTVSRIKDGLFKGYMILDPRWTAQERAQLRQLLNGAHETE